MAAPVILDVTRLATRVFNPTPNGIDRVDFAYARHFLGERTTGSNGLLLFPWGPRVVAGDAAGEIVRAIGDRWNADSEKSDDAALASVAAWLHAGPDVPRDRVARIGADRPRAIRSALPGIARAYLARHPDPPATNAIYLNVSQFPLWFAPYFRWAQHRSDIRIVPVIHDLLPVQHPEYFRGGEPARHRARLRFVAQRAAAAIVTTEATGHALRAFVRGEGRANLPLHVAPLPPESIFSEPARTTAHALDAHLFFLLVGTIEPRKNHLLILNVWSDLVASLGQRAPRLILVGRRGWKNEAVLDMLARSPPLRGHVLEMSDLSTPAMRLLMAHARAVLVPSFAEGYGLPVVEARAAGVPIIASDIPVFREIGGDAAHYVDPRDAAGWGRAIIGLAQAPRQQRGLREDGPNWQRYFGNVESFLSTLSG